MSFELNMSLGFWGFMLVIMLTVYLQSGYIFYLPIFPAIVFSVLMFIRSTLPEDEITSRNKGHGVEK